MINIERLQELNKLLNGLWYDDEYVITVVVGDDNLRCTVVHRYRDKIGPHPEHDLKRATIHNDTEMDAFVTEVKALAIKRAESLMDIRMKETSELLHQLQEAELRLAERTANYEQLKRL